jgi:hypothetical protein
MKIKIEKFYSVKHVEFEIGLGILNRGSGPVRCIASIVL